MQLLTRLREWSSPYPRRPSDRPTFTPRQIILELALVFFIAGVLYVTVTDLPITSLVAFAALLYFRVIREYHGRELMQRHWHRLTELMRHVDKISQGLPGGAGYHYEYLRIIYHVAEHNYDQSRREYKIVCDKETLYLENIYFGVLDADEPLGEFADLDLEYEIDNGEVLPVPIKVERDKIEGKLFFIPPLEKGSTVELSLDVEVPGTWGPLRETGSDIGYYWLGCKAEVFEIVVEVPKHFEDPTLIPTSPEPVRGELETRDRQSVTQLIWRIKDAEPDTYEYQVTVSR